MCVSGGIRRRASLFYIPARGQHDVLLDDLVRGVAAREAANRVAQSDEIGVPPHDSPLADAGRAPVLPDGAMGAECPTGTQRPLTQVSTV